MFWRKHWPKRRAIWSCATSFWHPQKRAKWKSRPDCVIQLKCWEVGTYASYETTYNIGELLPLRSIKNASSFKRIMVEHICSSSFFVVRLQSELYIYYIKLWAALKMTAGQRSLTVATAVATFKKAYRTVTMNATTKMQLTFFKKHQ